jgi:plasmid stabilization system protein ParE
MKVRLTARARQHLEAIAEYIGERNPSAAVRVGARIRQSIDLLAHFPLIGHAGVLAGTLEKVAVGLPYIIVYRVESDGETVTIVGVYHGAQIRPGQWRR